jgi:6-phospho-beta-glucosidase
MLIESLYADRGDVQVVNTRNDGAIPNVAADAVVELPCTITTAGARPLPVAPLEPAMHGLVEHAKAYERLTVQAAVSGNRDLALEALLANPLVGEFDVARPLLDALLAANREYLPRFFGRDAPA